jgi:hypothetical protein
VYPASQFKPVKEGVQFLQLLFQFVRVRRGLEAHRPSFDLVAVLIAPGRGAKLQRMLRQRHQKVLVEIGRAYAVLLTEGKQSLRSAEAACFLYHRQLLTPERLPQVSETLVDLEKPEAYQGIYEGPKDETPQQTIGRSRLLANRAA